MGIFVNKTDFANQTKHELSTGLYSDDRIDSYIERYEQDFIMELLGVELGNLFLADVANGLPVTPKYLKIFNSFYEQISFTYMASKGIKDMLVGFIYFQYAKDLATETTLIGVVKPQEQNSKVITAHTPIYMKYNESVKTYNAIQEYILFNMNDYPEFKGIGKKYAYWI